VACVESRKRQLRTPTTVQTKRLGCVLSPLSPCLLRSASLRFFVPVLALSTRTCAASFVQILPKMRSHGLLLRAAEWRAARGALVRGLVRSLLLFLCLGPTQRTVLARRERLPYTNTHHPTSLTEPLFPLNRTINHQLNPRTTRY